VTKPVAQMWYVVDRDGRLWWGANDAETAALSLFSQGYTVVRVDPDGTWDFVRPYAPTGTTNGARTP
jgi:sugar lactone lactonase YvrE